VFRQRLNKLNGLSALVEDAPETGAARVYHRGQNGAGGWRTLSRIGIAAEARDQDESLIDVKHIREWTRPVEWARRLNVLLDTHALIWWLLDDAQLPRRARAVIADADVVFVSSITAMEVCTKHRLGKLPQAALLAMEFEERIVIAGFTELPLTARHIWLSGNLSIANKDPFDRMLIAQSILEGIPLVSNEAAFESFGVSRIW
jgi:PIN domain nuclease of toxin-antitoxin system